MKKEYFIDIMSCLYIILFLYTGLFKLLGLTLFQAALAKSATIHALAPILAPTIPLLELSIVALLLIPFFSPQPQMRKWGLLAGSSLMAVFTIYVFYMIFIVSDVPCTCGGIIQKMTWRQHLYFNAGFSMLGFIAAWVQTRTQKTFSKIDTIIIQSEYPQSKI